MKRMIPTLLIFIVLMTASFGVVIGDGSTSTRQGGDGTLQSYIDNGQWQNIFWLYSQHKFQKIWRLQEYRPDNTGSNNVNIADLNSSFNNANSAMVFNFPYQDYPLAGITAAYEAGVTPCLNMTINTNYLPAKAINMEIRFDSNGDGSFETKALFNTYTTMWDYAGNDKVLNEERFTFFSTGYSSGPPGNMNNGRIQLAFWRSDGITDNSQTPGDEDWLTLYSGAYAKWSWAALPFKWQNLDPDPVIDPDEDQDPHDWWIESPEDPMDIHHHGYVANHTITFSAERSTSPIGANITTYDWNFGDPWANFQNPNTETGVVVQHKYSRPGVYKILLWATDVNMRVGRTDHWINISKDPGMPPEIESFSADPNPALVNMPVSFDIYASDPDGDPYDPPDFIWDFDGDGTWDTNQTQSGQIQYTYDTPGTYSLKVKAMDGPFLGNDTLYDEHVEEIVIKENDGPVVNFTVSTAFQTAHYPGDKSIMIIIGEELTFDFTDCYDPDNLPGVIDTDWQGTGNAHVNGINVEIDFKDGFGYISPDPFDKNDDPQPYGCYRYRYTTSSSIIIRTVTVKVTDGGITEEIPFKIMIDVAPKADAGHDHGTEDFGPDDVTTTDVVVFDGSGSYDPNDDYNGNERLDMGEVDNLTYQWDFGDNHSSSVSSKHFANHTFPEPGKYTATLTVTDPRGQTNRDTCDIWVLQPNDIPVALFTVDNTSKETLQEFLFDAATSYDLDDDENESSIVKYHWEFGDGTNGTGKKITHKYADDGEYRVNLTVEDDRGDRSEPITIVVTVDNQKPVAKIRKHYLDGVATNRFEIEDGNTFELTFTSESTDVDGSIVAYFWDFGDGTTKDWGNDTEVTHEYEKGLYKVTLKVRDDDGAESDVWIYKIDVWKKPEEKSPGFELAYVFAAVIVGLAVAVVLWKRH